MVLNACGEINEAPVEVRLSAEVNMEDVRAMYSSMRSVAPMVIWVNAVRVDASWLGLVTPYMHRNMRMSCDAMVTQICWALSESDMQVCRKVRQEALLPLVSLGMNPPTEA